MSNFINQVGGPTIVIFIGGIITLIGAVLAAVDQNRIGSRLEEKNEEIIRLNHSISDAITGGDSFCFLRIYQPSSNRKLSAIVVHSGDFPIYDVSCRIVDIDEFRKKADGSQDIYKGVESFLTLGNIAPTQAFETGPVFPTNTAIKRFNIFFSARNGFFVQQLRISILGDEMFTAMRVTRDAKDGSKIILFEEIQENYPKEPDGTINW